MTTMAEEGDANTRFSPHGLWEEKGKLNIGSAGG